jgi:hypothetical protein
MHEKITDMQLNEDSPFREFGMIVDSNGNFFLIS